MSDKRIQCKADPALETYAHLRLVHGNKKPNVRREPCEDALTCLDCAITFVGGPTTEKAAAPEGGA